MTQTSTTHTATITVSDRTYTFQITQEGQDFQCLLNGDLDSVLLISYGHYGPTSKWLYVDLDGDFTENDALGFYTHLDRLADAMIWDVCRQWVKM
jgi:hypothetical protein